MLVDIDNWRCQRAGFNQTASKLCSRFAINEEQFGADLAFGMDAKFGGVAQRFDAEAVDNVGAARPPKIEAGEMVRFTSSTRPASKRPALISPPPSQRRRLTFHSFGAIEGQRRSRGVSFPQTFTSSASSRSFFKRRSPARSVVRMISGAEPRLKISASGLIVPPPLTTTRSGCSEIRS